MSETQNRLGDSSATPPFRLDVQLHELLMTPGAKTTVPPKPTGAPQHLPDPVFPSRPKLQLGDDADYFPEHGQRLWTPPQILHTMKGWMFPYFKSRLL